MSTLHILLVPFVAKQAKQYSNGKVWEDGFNVQDGQGIPDCFSGHGRPNPEADGTMLVLGVGVCTGKKVDEWAGALLCLPPPFTHGVLLFSNVAAHHFSNSC